MSIINLSSKVNDRYLDYLVSKRANLKNQFPPEIVDLILSYDIFPYNLSALPITEAEGNQNRLNRIVHPLPVSTKVARHLFDVKLNPGKFDTIIASAHDFDIKRDIYVSVVSYDNIISCCIVEDGDDVFLPITRMTCIVDTYPVDVYCDLKQDSMIIGWKDNQNRWTYLRSQFNPGEIPKYLSAPAAPDSKCCTIL